MARSHHRFGAAILGIVATVGVAGLISAGCASKVEPTPTKIGGEATLVVPEPNTTSTAVPAAPKEVAVQESAPMELVAPEAQTPEVEPADVWQPVRGSIEPWRYSRVASEEAGRVTSAAFSEGDVVKDGAVLVTLDDTSHKLAVAREEAATESARLVAEDRSLEAERASQELGRLEDLKANASVSSQELDAAKTRNSLARSAAAQARAALALAEATLRDARRRLDRLAIKAPFAGVIVSKKTELGEWVNAHDAVASVVDVNTLEVRLWIPEEFINAIKPGTSKARVAVPAASVGAELVIVSVLPDIDIRTRCYPARAKFDNKDGVVKPDMNVECSILVTKAGGSTSERTVESRMDSRKPE
jgi:RND family efflux transporter MFP subunit